jgi:hypothetical protein
MTTTYSLVNGDFLVNQSTSLLQLRITQERNRPGLDILDGAGNVVDDTALFTGFSFETENYRHSYWNFLTELVK